MEYSGRVPQFDGLVNENIYLLVTGKISDICEWQLEQLKAPKKHLMAFFLFKHIRHSLINLNFYPLPFFSKAQIFFLSGAVFSRIPHNLSHKYQRMTINNYPPRKC